VVTPSTKSIEQHLETLDPITPEALTAAVDRTAGLSGAALGPFCGAG
jgi:hypothetical protein